MCDKFIIDDGTLFRPVIPPKLKGSRSLFPRFYSHPFGEIITSLKDCDIIHVMFGEESFFLASVFKRFNKKKYLVTLHHPPDIFLKSMPFFWKRILSKADRIITISNYQKEFFQKNLKNDIVFVPHGVDTEIGAPIRTKEKAKKKICLTTGQWLRDFQTYAIAVRSLLMRDVDLEFVIVVPFPRIQKRLTSFFPKHKKIRILTGLSDDDLICLYRESSIFVLPLIDSTANNSLLEAMAFGLPLVTTDVGGVGDYVDEDCAVLVSPKKPRELERAIIQLAKDEGLRERLGEKSRERAENFDWNKTASRTLALYSDLTQR